MGKFKTQGTFESHTLLISILLLFLTSITPAYSQNQTIDSLQQLLNNHPEDTEKIQILLELTTAYYKANEPLKAVESDSAALLLSEKLNFSEGQGDAYHKLGIIKLRAAEYDESLKYFEEALKIRTQDQDLKRMSYTNINMGVIYMTLNDYESADYHYNEALKIGKKLNDTVSIGGAYINLGIVSMELANYDTSIARLNKGIELYEIIDAKRGAGDGYNCLGGVYQDLGEYDTAIQNYQKAIGFYKQVKNVRGVSAATLNIGNIHRRQGNFPKALEAYQRALEIKIEAHDKKGQALVFSNIGLLYQGHGEYEKALEYINKSLELNKEIQISRRVGQAYTYLAETYTEMGEFEKAYDNYIRGLEILQNLTAVKTEANILNGLGKVKLAQKEYAEALIFYQKAKEKDVGVLLILGETLEGLALSHLGLKNYNSSEKAALAGYKISQELEILELNQSLTSVLSQIYAIKGNYKKAYEFEKLHKIYSDSLFNSENIKKLTQLELEYAFNEEKKQILADQEKNDLILQNELYRRKLIQYSAIGGGILFLLLFLNVYRSYRRKKKDNEIIQDQNRNITMAAAKLKASNERLSELNSLKEGVNHMIANDMKQSVSSILDSTQEKPTELTLQNINRTGTVMLNLVTNMLDVQAFEEQNVKLNKEKFPIHELIENAWLQSNSLSVLKSLKLNIEVPTDMELYADIQVMHRVFVNLFINAVNHSFEKGTISISASLANNQVICSITSLGEEVSEEHIKKLFDSYWESIDSEIERAAAKGLGLAYCKMAVDAHNGKIEVKSQKGKITIELHLPN